MNKLLLLALVLVSIPSEGQSLKKLKVFCTDNFEPNSTVTVKPPKDDRLFLADALKNSLVMNGFKVISEKVAQEKLELINKKESTDTTLKQEVSLSNTTYIKSVYIINFNYSYYLNHSHIAELTGQVVDLANEGVIVATFSYSQGALSGIKVSNVTDALAKAFKEKQKSK